jgi:hypothetical protein
MRLGHPNASIPNSDSLKIREHNAKRQMHFFVLSARFGRYSSDDFGCVSAPVEPVSAGLSALFFAGPLAVEARDFPA